MAFRRGFKSQCERRAVEVRKDLRLNNLAPLNAFDLANHFKITVWSTIDIVQLSQIDQKNLNEDDEDSWSALTLRDGIHNLIIYKEYQSKYRINSVVMHELSHIMLGHELANACKLEDGSVVPSNFTEDQEDEANWLAGTLLLPRPLLLFIEREKFSHQHVTEEFGVSQDMLIWRKRMTGVSYQIKNS